MLVTTQFTRLVPQTAAKCQTLTLPIFVVLLTKVVRVSQCMHKTGLIECSSDVKSRVAESEENVRPFQNFQLLSITWMKFGCQTILQQLAINGNRGTQQELFQ